MPLRFFSLIVCLFLLAPSLAQSSEAEVILQHEAGVVTAAWNSDETQILTATERGAVQVWALPAGELLLTIEHGGIPLTHALWVAAGAQILSADESGSVRLSAAHDGSELRRWQFAGMPVALEVAADGGSAMVFTDSGGGALLPLTAGGQSMEFAASGAISGASLSTDGSRLRAWTEEGAVFSWHLEAGTAEETRPPHRGLLLGLQWSADDARVLAWFADGLVNLYESDGVSIGRGRISGLRHNSFVQRAIWSRDESMVMSWAGDDTVHIWSARDGRSQQVYRHEDWVIGARWDHDERRVLSWSHIYVYLWDADGFVKRFRHRNLLRGAVWDAAGERVLSWSWDGTARVWKV